ncbi:MAG: MFS transporter [Desulfosarcinaceae bacterium]|nr:MFS transporter [Desulfosarcinaceae bacterium]
MMPKNTLYSQEFIWLCSVTFLAVCNVAVFYNLHLYLAGLGFHGRRAGFLIGLYSLSAMLLYLLASKSIRPANAVGCMAAGIFVVLACGFGYLAADQYWTLALVRLVNGIGIFLVMAACMVVLVATIPPERTGSAFSLYSVALLSPYALMPTMTEQILAPVMAPNQIYLATACCLVPILAALPRIGRHIGAHHRDAALPNRQDVEAGGRHRNLLRKPVLSILVANTLYFIVFSGLFFLFKGLAVERGVSHPGRFFSIQMGIMIAIRLMGGRLFDRYSKVGLVTVAMLITAAGFLLLWGITDPVWTFALAVVFGIGMGLCVPPLNSLMYLVSAPHHRGYNANMMMLSIHLGTFAGPFLGAWIIGNSGYDRFLLMGAVVTLGGALFFALVNPARNLIADQG